MVRTMVGDWLLIASLLRIATCRSRFHFPPLEAVALILGMSDIGALIDDDDSVVVELFLSVSILRATSIVSRQQAKMKIAAESRGF